MDLSEPHVLVCEDRRWPWSDTVTAVLNRLAARHSDRLVVIEGAASGADRAAHQWCKRNGYDADRHGHIIRWKGFATHVTETCASDSVNVITDVATNDGQALPGIHTRLARRGLLHYTTLPPITGQSRLRDRAKRAV